MELTPGQRKAAFAVIVAVLLALGAFLILSRAPGKPARRAAAHQASSPPAAAATQPPASPSPAGSPAPGSPAGSAGVDIYRLLPFSQPALSQAVAVTERFAAAYGTYSYQQSAGSYAASMRGLASPELTASLARSYATPGVAQIRTRQKQVSTGQGIGTALRAFGPGSITFVVTLVQRITESQGHSQQNGQYAITVTSVAGQWQVSDIQLASAGNS